MGRPKNPERERIVRVKSNVKSADGTPWEACIPGGSDVLVVGPNASMKSAFIQAVTLATGGYADDVAGRDGVRDPSLLLTMVQGDRLSTEVETSTGHIWRFEAKRDGGTVKKAVWTLDGAPAVGTDALPVSKVKDVLRMGEAKARPEVLRWMGRVAALTSVDVRSKLGASLQARYVAAVENLGKASKFASPVDEMLAAGAWAKEAAGAAKKEVGIAKTVLSGIAEGAVPPTEMELARALSDVKDATDTLETAARWSPAPDVEDLGRQLQEAMEAARQWEERVKSIQSKLQLDDGSPQLDTVPYLLQWIDYGIQVDQCPVCGEPGTADHLRDSSRPHFETMLSKVKEASDDLRDANSCLAGWSNEVRRLTDAIADAGRVERRQKPNVTVEMARQALAEAQARHEALTAAAASAAQVKRAKDKIVAKEAEVQDLEKLVSAVAEATKILLLQSRKRFCDVVSGKLPKSWRDEGIAFDVEVEDRGREVCRVGLRGGPRGLDLRPALSGVEWEVVTMGIAASVSSDASKLRLLVPSDRAWDPVTLADTCRALGTGTSQSMIASTVRPFRKCPSGWVVLSSETMQVDAKGVEAVPTDKDIPEDVRKIADEVLQLAQAANTGHPESQTPSNRSVARRLRDLYREHGREKMRQLYTAITGLQPERSAATDSLVADIESTIRKLELHSPDAPTETMIPPTAESEPSA